jgi:hypothetical protein
VFAGDGEETEATIGDGAETEASMPQTMKGHVNLNSEGDISILPTHRFMNLIEDWCGFQYDSMEEF